MRKSTRVFRIMYILIILFLYALTTIGYCLSGVAWYDAFYYAVQIFLLEYSAIDNPHIFIYVCRVLCPIMTITSLFIVVGKFYRMALNVFLSKRKGATAIYYDTEQIFLVSKRFKCPIMMKDKINKIVKHHVIALNNDIDNLLFFDTLKKEIKTDSKVYVLLKKVESGLLKNTGNEVNYININEIIARKYWQERNLAKYLSKDGMTVKIAIIGFEALGQILLDYALINNIYSLNQKIEYHIWGDSDLYRNVLGNFDMMNQDTIVYHDSDWKEDLVFLQQFDRIVVTYEADLIVLQALLNWTTDAEIDYFNPEGTQLSEFYEKGNHLKSFGTYDDVLTESNIKSDTLYREAKELNFSYQIIYGDKGYTWEQKDLEEKMHQEWCQLDHFKKNSNIASADYHKIRLLVMNGMNWTIETLSQEQKNALVEMEHIRWCRYHYVNHWTYDEIRDDSKRKHPCLVSFTALDEQTKEKDLNTLLKMFKEKR